MRQVVKFQGCLFLLLQHDRTPGTPDAGEAAAPLSDKRRGKGVQDEEKEPIGVDGEGCKFEGGRLREEGGQQERLGKGHSHL